MPAPYRGIWEVGMPIKYTPEQLEGPPKPYKPPFKVTSTHYHVDQFEFSDGQRIKVTRGGKQTSIHVLSVPHHNAGYANFTPEELDGFISFLQGLSKVNG